MNARMHLQIRLNATRGEAGDYSPGTAALACTGCATRLFTTMQLAGGDTLLIAGCGLVTITSATAHSPHQEQQLIARSIRQIPLSYRFGLALLLNGVLLAQLIYFGTRSGVILIYDCHSDMIIGTVET